MFGSVAENVRSSDTPVSYTHLTCGKFVQVSNALTLGAAFTAASYSVPNNSTQYLSLIHISSRLDALTGLRCFAAINIVFFHFSNPDWFGWFAPVVNAGYASVSFFILLSGFVLAYNYAPRARAGTLDRTRFWEARFTRLYPIYLLSLILSWRMIPCLLYTSRCV